MGRQRVVVLPLTRNALISTLVSCSAAVSLGSSRSGTPPTSLSNIRQVADVAGITNLRTNEEACFTIEIFRVTNNLPFLLFLTHLSDFTCSRQQEYFFLEFTPIDIPPLVKRRW